MNDDQIIFENINNIYMQLCKYYLEELYDCGTESLDIDESYFLRRQKNKNKIEYVNFMYSDKYDKSNNKVKEVNGKLSMNISIFDAIKTFENNFVDWPSVVIFVGKWYEQNIHTYQGSTDGVNGTMNPSNMYHKFDHQIIGKVRDDCTGFVTACVLTYICALDFFNDLLNDTKYKRTIESWLSTAPSSFVWDSLSNSSDEVTNLKNLMNAIYFEEIPYKFEKLQPFDIIAGNDGKFHHAEIYAGNDNGSHKSWSWGNIHDKNNGGMPAYFCKPNDNSNAYKTIWRLKGLEKITDKKLLGFA